VSRSCPIRTVLFVLGIAWASPGGLHATERPNLPAGDLLQEPDLLRVPAQAPDALLPVLFLLCAALALAFAFLAARRRVVAPPPPPATAGPAAERFDAVAALDGLIDAIGAAGKEADPDGFHVSLSRIARRCLGQRFGFSALERTVPEVADALASAGALPDALLTGLLDSLRRLEAAKYSDAPRALEGALAAAKDVRERIERLEERRPPGRAASGEGAQYAARDGSEGGRA